MRLALFVDAAPHCAHDDTVQPLAETKNHHRRYTLWMMPSPCPGQQCALRSRAHRLLCQCMQITTVGLEQSAEHSMLQCGKRPSGGAGNIYNVLLFHRRSLQRRRSHCHVDTSGTKRASDL
jgi:hypothetical protein